MATTTSNFINNTNNKNDDEDDDDNPGESTKSCTIAPPIAIVGGSYAGLALANVLHAHSVPYAVLESKSLPFAHVDGGAAFDVPSYEAVARALELKGCNARGKERKAKRRSSSERLDDDDDGGHRPPTRKEVIDALLDRVKPNLVASRRVARVERRASSGLLYLHCSRRRRRSTRRDDDAEEEEEEEEADGHGARINGPFRAVVGADGVLSLVRVAGLPGTFLVGDARWVNDRWYDLGLRRIRGGADTALRDGLELGEAIVGEEEGRRFPSKTRDKFCACRIARRRTNRMFAIAAAMLALVLFKYFDEVAVLVSSMQRTEQCG